ncbi:hypothetical protein FF38_07662 [Lucilia cuprina]|uniref:Uncharacterized protein n=1 Tax=Lucilia cuprina TaxID=7375 RepID=A0A0L0CD59_LUCCU|nr:hypothetical protein FF38_07662 [Lucilia cuprina]
MRPKKKFFLTSCTKTTATPSLSNWGRPARPIICKTSVIGISTYFFTLPSKYSVPLITTKWAGPASKRFFQSLIRSLTKAFNGAIYTTLALGVLLNALNMAISATIVLPEPVGAPSRTLLSYWGGKGSLSGMVITSCCGLPLNTNLRVACHDKHFLETII